MEADSHTDSLPDRLMNPGEYEPVLLTTEEHTAAELIENMQGVSQQKADCCCLHVWFN